MIILGIDPGTRVTGFGVIQYERGKISYIDSGNIVVDGLTLSQKVKNAYLEIAGIVDKYNPEVGVVESIFYSKNVKTTLKLAHLRGVILFLFEEKGIPLFEFSPLEVKQSLTGYGRSDKKQVKKMVSILLGLKEENFSDKYFDNFDALALSICYVNHFLQISYNNF